MADPARSLESEALKLPANERARLAERLISSLDPEVDPDAEERWIEEAERRLDQLESGEASGVPADQAIERGRSSLR
jgi:putative addiction module component (TIGR02574 family)